MLRPEELYEGLPRETAERYRNEAVEKYGNDAVDKSEKSLLKMSKDEVNGLRKEQLNIQTELAELIYENPGSEKVQKVITRHYALTRKFWGTHGSEDLQLKQYAGLGDLYVSDKSYLMKDGKPQQALAEFMKAAMHVFIDNQ